MTVPTVESDGVRRGGLRIAAMIAVALVIAACASGKVKLPPCPNVLILGKAGSLVRFVDGPGRDITDVVFRARIADFQGSCAHEDNAVDVKLLITFAVERGPANKDRRAAFEYFVAIPRFHPRPEGKRRFRIGVPFAANATRVFYRDELNLDIPLRKGEVGANYDVFIGFQLSPSELEFNRTRRTR